jgi:hypothetical protein
MHMGAASGAAWVQNWADRIVRDQETLGATCHGHVNGGDLTHDSTGTWDAAYRAWRAALNLDGLPYLEAVGNHDLEMPAGTIRTAAQWAAAVGVCSQNRVADMGDVRVITIGPDLWGTNNAAGEQVLSEATLVWLDEQLTAAGSRPCFIAAHCALAQQYPEDVGISVVYGPSDRLTEIIDGHPNAVGWLSGHKHVPIDTRPEHARTMTVGSRTIYAINGPPAGGGKLPGMAWADHQWKNVNQSMYLTYLGDALDVRWRDHLAGKWVRAADERVRHLILTS